ncbi:MAG: phosphotransferase family protein [Haliea sp.]|jgi:aminoglycoside phosphotransferase (APT) family kinase protein|uniref:phosphotransferase family protein n=1 Tax=Haliea sp. TaxID=1932666 RepID=UPI000C3AE660|nr:phosphotransferase family protein [Haliea sp.]MAD62141.1 phosphotransferase family protein [Haliea sp.]MBK41615.1 phosphotransferase family protein [Haliea sp.]MBP70877.1 phosphotransferase family protein [Haliea sp.]HCD56582.1 phosphotransferase family protein [Halieaceae bacterium]|tara:strand:+ start:7269 stop:8459 length:1191 start_codon:yes stop_codon:yes gene_type:complete
MSLKDKPTEEWINSLRSRYPVEREVDRVLVRKLKNRPGSTYRPQNLESLIEGVDALITSCHNGAFAIKDAFWLTGGASKLQMAFTLSWCPDGNNLVDTRMVLRMEPAASVCETSRLREHEILGVFDGIVPVPKPYWVDELGDFLPYPALIYEFSLGVTKPAYTVSNVTGLGTNLGPELRERLAPQFVEQLALIHNHDINDSRLVSFDIPDEPKTASLWTLNWWQRVWEEDCGQDIPLMSLASSWMRANLPDTDRLSIVHADYRTGNFLFDESSAVITAWLDWELAHIGDRHEDLAWTLSPAFGHFSEDGSGFLSCGLMSEAEFLDRYERASGFSVDSSKLQFYRILSAYKAIVIVLGAGYRIARNGKSHQDVLLVWLMGLASPLLAELAGLLEEVI